MRKLDRTLIIGIGNSGRQDDGIGWLFLDLIKEFESKPILEYRYQLQIEDAELISKYDTVIFVDATKEDTAYGYYIKLCQPSGKYSFSTHTLVPETILYLSHKLYNHNPETYIFAIQGYEWKLKIGLSEKGILNLNKALKHFKNNILIDYI